MTVKLTDEQWGAVYNALLTVANGYWWRDGERSTRLSRTQSVDICRQAVTALGYSWQDYQPKKGAT
jgi:hypothetical protein